MVMQTGRVVGVVGRVVARLGDPQTLAGTRVRFRALAGPFPAGGELVIPDPVECRVDDRGQLLDPTDADGARLGVELAATDVPGREFTFEVRISAPSISPVVFHILVPTGATVDLATVAHVPGTESDWTRDRQTILSRMVQVLPDPEAPDERALLIVPTVLTDPDETSVNLYIGAIA